MATFRVTRTLSYSFLVDAPDEATAYNLVSRTSRADLPGLTQPEDRMRCEPSTFCWAHFGSNRRNELVDIEYAEKKLDACGIPWLEAFWIQTRRTATDHVWTSTIDGSLYAIATNGHVMMAGEVEGALPGEPFTPAVGLVTVAARQLRGLREVDSRGLYRFVSRSSAATGPLTIAPCRLGGALFDARLLEDALSRLDEVKHVVVTALPEGRGDLVILGDVSRFAIVAGLTDDGNEWSSWPEMEPLPASDAA